MSTSTRILIVDDEVNFTEALEMFLADKGYKVHVANNGKEALSLIKEYRFDLMILDLMMPEIDGIHVAKVTREYIPSTKIIVVTGHMDKYEAELKELHLDGIMQKPIVVSALVEKIIGIMGESPCQPESVSQDGVPKAKLLFIEKHDIVYINLFKPYFDEINSLKEARYELALIDDKQKAVDIIKLWRPDIILLNTAMIDCYKNIQSELHDTVGLVNEIILHGKELYVKTPRELGVDPKDVTAVEGGKYDSKYPKRLEEEVRLIARKRGLVC